MINYAIMSKLSAYPARLRKIRATIYYTIDKYHPDYIYTENPEEEQSYTDTYTIDMNYFNGMDHVKSYIKNDLRTVAGGGYTTSSTHNVRYEFEYLTI